MAGTFPKVRLVKCPKCDKLLTESADVPVYQCGGCDTILRAKYHITRGENVASGSIEISGENVMSRSLENGSMNISDGSSLNTRLTSSSEQIIASSPKMDYKVEQAAPSNYFSESKATSSRYEKGKSSNNGEHVIEARDSDHNIPGPSNSLPLESVSNLNVEMEKPLKLSSQGHDNLRLSDKMEVSSKPISWSVPSEEDMVERGLGDIRADSSRSTTRSSNAYYGSASSADSRCNDHVPHKYRLLSRRTFRHKKILYKIDSKGKKARENGMTNEVTTAVGLQLQSSNLPAKSSDESHTSGTVRRYDSKRVESSSRHGILSIEGETSLDSEHFHSVQNWMEPEKDAPSGSLLRDSAIHADSFNCQIDSPSPKFGSLKPAQMRILKKVDELRDELSELFDQTVEGKRKPQLRSIRDEGRTQSLHSRLVPSPVSYLSRKDIHKKLQFFQDALVGQAHCSCLHCYHEVCRTSLQTPPNICCNKGLCRASPKHPCYHSSKAISPEPRISPSLPLHSHKAQAHVPESEKLHSKERRQAIKRHCRPVSGGAPFVICSKCLKLLQLPADFLVSKRRFHELQCGACYEVLVYSFRARDPKIPRMPVEVQHPPSEVENSMYAINRNEITASHSNEYAQGDPFSFSEEYGLSFAKSDSTEPETALHVSRNSSCPTEEQYVRQVKNLQLHQLLGYSSASELLYQLGDVNERYQSNKPRPPCFHRPSEESDTREGLQGKEIRSPHHQYSIAETSSNFMEIHKEDESPMRSRNRRGVSPLRGLLKKGMRELNHGLESVKQKIQSNGRTISTSKSRNFSSV